MLIARVEQFQVRPPWGWTKPTTALKFSALCLAWSFLPSAQAGVVPVEKGQPRAAIVVAAGAIEQAREAAT